MKRPFYLSDRKKGFRPQSSLSEEPITFETTNSEGGVFYLPTEEVAGGDSFAIKADEYFTVSLLEDMTGHGRIGNLRMTPFISDLETLTMSASKKDFEPKEFVKKIAQLDAKLDPSSLIALSFARIQPDGTLCYLNEGENQFILYREGRIENVSREVSHGKIGLFKFVIGDTKSIVEAVSLSTLRLKKDDRLLICSDGVVDLNSMDSSEERIEEIENCLAYANSTQEIIKDINNAAERRLRRRGAERPDDDYTLIALQVK